ncbi:UDP-glycosyltransferase 76C4 [Morella rubra]|uniref:UDP-glycosyltransferase 76C4 n=1 Tax=Morella rubra TaxID=262757 RepID=A0A6A1VXT8_9ROSI|nr:UDP-glycosyltransferase 76C4 [Morella rubra]
MENPRDNGATKHRKGRRVVLFPLPLQGHISPMLQLANILCSKGFAITIIHTRFNSPSSSKHPNFSFISISDGLSESEASTADVIALVTVLNVNCVLPFRNCLAKLLSDSLEEPVACIITDADWHFTQAVADSFKLPRIVLRTSSVFSFFAYATLPVLRERGYFPIEESQLEEPVPNLSPLKAKDLPLIDSRDPEDLYRLFSCIFKDIKVSSGLIWNTFEELEQSELITFGQEFPIPVFPVGPLHRYFPASTGSLLTEDRSCLSWLSTQAPKSVLYVSFGSLAAFDETQFEAMAWGLAKSKQPFLWVVRPGLVRGSEWLETLPNGFLETIEGRGHIVKWAPQQEVLAHPATGGFCTHNGWNSTFESICEGVPMICLPCHGDQKVNARYVTDVWKIGVHLENRLESGEIERAIRRLMVDSEGHEMRDRVMNLKEKVDLSLRQGGSYRALESLISHISSF